MVNSCKNLGYGIAHFVVHVLEKQLILVSCGPQIPLLQKAIGQQSQLPTAIWWIRPHAGSFGPSTYICLKHDSCFLGLKPFYATFFDQKYVIPNKKKFFFYVFKRFLIFYRKKKQIWVLTLKGPGCMYPLLFLVFVSWHVDSCTSVARIMCCNPVQSSHSREGYFWEVKVRAGQLLTW